MSDISIPARKFTRLLDYLGRIGIDVHEVAAGANFSVARLTELPASAELPAKQYGRLYKSAITEVQKLNQPIPWAAGVGTEAFELMCHCMIGAKTLGGALELATRFEQLTYPLLSHNMRLLREDAHAVLSYKVNVEPAAKLVPKDWDRSAYQETVAKASGLAVWHALCGWLIGEPLNASAVRISAPYLNDQYFNSLQQLFKADIAFDAQENTLRFDIEYLDRRIVHNADSLREFLKNAVYELVSFERKPASTSAAIRSLIAKDLPEMLPSFSLISEYLHVSESSLRRRLFSENTNYQQLKDEVRCQIAVDKLLNEDVKIAELSEFLRFAEPSSFIRSFKSWTGETPSSYREKMVALSI